MMNEIMMIIMELNGTDALFIAVATIVMVALLWVLYDVSCDVIEYFEYNSKTKKLCSEDRGH